eukprot:jgi/Botrbrau1/19474/Bobra.0338s0091.1
MDKNADDRKGDLAVDESNGCATGESEKDPCSILRHSAKRRWASPTIQIPECNITIQPPRYSKSNLGEHLRDEDDTVELASPLTPLLDNLEGALPPAKAVETPHLEPAQTPSLPPSRVTSRRGFPHWHPQHLTPLDTSHSEHQHERTPSVTPGGSRLGSIFRRNPTSPLPSTRARLMSRFAAAVWTPGRESPHVRPGLPVPPSTPGDQYRQVPEPPAPEPPSDEDLLQNVPNATIRKTAAVSLSTDFGAYRTPARQIMADSMPATCNFSGPLPIPIRRDMEARIQSLGTELPTAHKAILWVGIILDICSKASLYLLLVRFARSGKWYWFAMVLGFFLMSGALVTAYWLTHYPGALAERALKSRSDLGLQGRVYGLPKTTFKAWVRRLGTLCAVLQLGTAFAASRALFVSEVRQRLVAMDLRGIALGGHHLPHPHSRLPAAVHRHQMQPPSQPLPSAPGHRCAAAGECLWVPDISLALLHEP